MKYLISKVYNNRYFIILTCILILLTLDNVISKLSDKEAIITYSFKNNGKLSERASLLMYYKNGIVSYKSSYGRSSDKEKEYLNFNDRSTYQLLTLGDDVFYLKKSFDDYEKPKLLEDEENILGYDCQKAVLNIKSNTIEIWYTNELGIKGSPRISVAPGIGLILKMIRNKDYEVFANDIEYREIKKSEQSFDLSKAKEVNNALYLRKVIESRFQTITVFDKDQINYGDTIYNSKEDHLNKTYRYSNGTVILKKIKLPKIFDGSTVMAEVNSWSNGDAYDRNGSLFIIPVEKEQTFLDAFKYGIDRVPVYLDNNNNEFQGVVCTEDYEPPLELMRFFTPFGVCGFNDYTQIYGYDWADSAKYVQEITDLIPHEGKEVWIGIFIGNYDKGGHLASLRLKIHPSYRNRDQITQKWVKPIFNTMNIMEMSQQNYGTMFHDDSLTINVEIPEGLENLYLRYTSTGHGGWGGGDEFNPKLNEIFIDDELIYKFIPWRDDCATYRLLNPASGNFGNGLTSSDLSRSNWCPGTVTVPEIIRLDNLNPGLHTLKVAIPIGEKEGGSFSSWNVSGTLIGELQDKDD